MSEPKKLPDDQFQHIYSDKQFRNAVAFAHERFDSKLISHGYIAQMYPETYIVTTEQISIAKTIYLEAKKRTFEEHKSDLIFCGMGCDYEAQYDDDVCNHRVWTQLENANGRHLLIEFSHTTDFKIYLSAYHDFDAEDEYNKKWEALKEDRDKYKSRDNEWRDINKNMQNLSTQITYNSHPLMHERIDLKYTRANVLSLINKHFDCMFNNIIIDQYNIHPNDQKIFCYSPTKKIMVAIQQKLF